MNAAKNTTETPEDGGSRNNHPFPWLNMMVTEPFYLFHFLIFFSYLVARSSASFNLSPDLSQHLLRREIQAFLTFSVLATVKMVKEETWEAFIADTLFYAKIFLFALALIINYHLALCYAVGFLVIFVLAQQPPYDELGDSNRLTPLQLESLLTEGNTSRFWLVEFRAMWSSTCIRTSCIFPHLSITYSNKDVSFGTVDLGHFPSAAGKFGISLSDQLPTYILFENGSEVARLPEISCESKTSMPTISKNLLCRYFELDRRLVDYISKR